VNRPEPPAIGVGLYSFQIGGSERIGAELALGYARRGYRVSAFAFYDSNGPIREHLESAHIEALDLNYLKGRWGIRRFTYQARLWPFLRRRQFSALHVHHTTALLLCGIPARAAGVPSLLMTEHAIHELEADPRYKRNARLYCRLAHQITVVHPGLVEYFHRDIRVPLGKLSYVPNGVAIPCPSGDREATRASLDAGGDFVLLFAGRLHPTKDLGTMLRAAALLARQEPKGWQLWLVGGGGEEPALRSLASSLGLDSHVRFLGEKSDVETYLEACDSFVMSSRTEGLPMALIEAMSWQKPCLATDVGGIRSLFEDRAGLVVRPGDPEVLSVGMMRLMKDAALRRRLGENGLAIVRSNYNLEGVIDRYLGLMGLPAQWNGQHGST
jgi:glycosyltransferase involved in cell wall biosynthesis